MLINFIIEIMMETPFICDMSVFEPMKRTEHIENMKELFNSVQEIDELENGFTFPLKNDSLTSGQIRNTMENHFI